jgi:hypothetical protein
MRHYTQKLCIAGFLVYFSLLPHKFLFESATSFSILAYGAPFQFGPFALSPVTLFHLTLLKLLKVCHIACPTLICKSESSSARISYRFPIYSSGLLNLPIMFCFGHSSSGVISQTALQPSQPRYTQGLLY